MFPRRLHLGWASLAVVSAGSALAWEWTGYVREAERDWFSLRDPAGGAFWVAADRPGVLQVVNFDADGLVLTVRIDGREERLALNEARLGASAALERAAVQAPEHPLATPFTPEIAGEAPGRAALRRVQVSAAADQIERREAKRQEDLTLVARARATSVAAAESGVKSSGKSTDWATVYRRVAERRAQMAVREAEERLRREAQAR